MYYLMNWWSIAKNLWDREMFRRTHRILIPMIRRIVPASMAKDILGVQPMSAPTSEIFTMKTRYEEEHDNERIQ